jgi:N-acetylglucosaminyldiphosphoundecaprenol N-acetyl-beta-D-mannosaminyltransferase
MGQRSQSRERMSAREKKNIVGILIDPVDRATATQMILEAARQRRGYAVSAMAVHAVMTGVFDSVQRHRLNHLDLAVADGQPVRWALNFLYSSGLRDRVYGPDLTLDLLARAEQEGLPVYFYGTTQEILDGLCTNLRERFPRLHIAGAAPSTFGRVSKETADETAGKIKQSWASMVFAGLGCPRQEVWAFEFAPRLNLPIIAVGAAFPFLAGTLPQAPRWMQDRGLEWLFRLCKEPRRLWRRYLILSPPYLFLVLLQRLGLNFNPNGESPEGEILYG